MTFILSVAVLVWLVVPPGNAYAQSESFEVASVKPNRQVVSPRVGFLPGGRFEAIGATLMNLIALAYGPDGIRRSQIVGGPSWITTDQFNISATTGERGPGNGQQQLPARLRGLLADRFKLQVHRERREQPVYTLGFARSDRRLGPALRKADLDCAARVALLPKSGPRPMVCGIDRGPGRSMGRSMGVSELVGVLSSLVERFVVDQTALDGPFDWDLEWSPEPGDPSSPSGPSIFAAVQEQLGLRLTSSRAPVDVLVIDRVERPAAD